MKNKVTFDSYIANPAGKSASAVTNKDMYKNMYTEKFNSVLAREQGKLSFKVYSSNKTSEDAYFIHIKMPSENRTGIYYDTVIKLFTKDKEARESLNIKDYQVQFYSNDQAFVYTFCHAFNKYNLFIKELSSKMSKEALTKRAKTKNPNDSIWYVKSFYFAYLFMVKENLFSKEVLDEIAKPYHQNELLKDISSFEEKMAERNELIKEPSDKSKSKLQKKRNENISTPNSRLTKTTNTVKNVKSVSNIKLVRTTRTNSKTKKS